VGYDTVLRVWCRAELMVDHSEFMSVEGFTKNEVMKKTVRVDSP